MNLFEKHFQKERLNKLGDPLARLNMAIKWEMFRPLLSTIWDNPDRKSPAGNKPKDVILMFKIVILQKLYNLSDDGTEYQVVDRESFKRFLGIDSVDDVPDAKTLWAFKERIKEKGLEKKLFALFDEYLTKQGFSAKSGQIIDATMVEIPRQRNTREENKQIKEQGTIPEKWKENTHKMAQKDIDARWTKKNNETFYGYKDHINIDQGHKLIRDYEVTPAHEHDSVVFDSILDTTDKKREIYADSAYRSDEKEKELKKAEMTSQISEKGKRNSPLTQEQKESNRIKSKVRARVEHVFGHMQQSMGGIFICSIGIARARMNIGLMNLTYNLSRFAYLEKVKQGDSVSKCV